MTVYCDCAFARVVGERRIANAEIAGRANRRIAAPIVESSRTAERIVTAEHESIGLAGRAYDFCAKPVRSLAPERDDRIDQRPFDRRTAARHERGPCPRADHDRAGG